VLQWWPKPYRVDGVAKLQLSGYCKFVNGNPTKSVWFTFFANFVASETLLSGR